MDAPSILHPQARKLHFRKPAPFSPPLGVGLRGPRPRGNRCPPAPPWAASPPLLQWFPQYLPRRAPLGSRAKVRWALRVPCKLWQRGPVGCCPAPACERLRDKGTGLWGSWRQAGLEAGVGLHDAPRLLPALQSWLPGSERGSAGPRQPLPPGSGGRGDPAHPRTSAD